MISIFQDTKECFICKNPMEPLHRHHIFYGTANRQISEREGCVAYLCPEHHTGKNGVHNNRQADLYLKWLCQKKWMEYNDKTEQDFIKTFGRSYLL